MALDQRSNEILFSDPTLGQSYVIDAATLELKNKIAIDNPIEGVPDKDYWCTLADRDRGWWIAQQNGKVALLNAAGDHVVAQHTFGVNFLDYYRQRDEVVLVSGVCGILALLDPRTFEVKKVVRLAPFPEKFALDQQTGIVYLAFSVLGRIMAFDLNENRIKAWIPSFPGVRTVAIDRIGRRLIAGGFAPLIEVRALDDFRLIERLTAPPWSRGLDVDQQRGRLFFTSALYGLWMLDLTDLPETAPLWQRIDPFYHLVRWADLLVQHASGIFGECDAFYEREGY